jgi:hypothetical protein
MMKTIAVTLIVAALGFAQSQSDATTPAKKENAKTAAPAQKSATQSKKPAQPSNPSPDQKVKAQTQAQSIPAGATAVEPNLYRYTDSNGKTWNYRQTPFGISKWEETSAPQPVPAKNEPTVVTDLGDSYRFEKKTPFGASTWVRKKSELTDEEKDLTGVQQPQSDSKPAGVASKPAGHQ